ncbi:hypothetical protein GCM10008955_31320 [Deinococcus malanensis]|uniref:Uncharacterized protein n=1 Tax=Deinococcus malanensis TaxID=1706855 RepID=A0ABQ2EZ86_9DEIO|nr:hypothetical protein [Deinococcus malanensis]GGK35132.1 hypothetical protein GCM10008955_31320 [Deinococcus malanensis]
MCETSSIKVTAVRAVIDAQIAVTTAGRHDLLPEIRTLRRLYKNAPVQPEALHQVREAALAVMERLRAS